MNSLANQPRIDNVVLNNAQHDQKDEHYESQKEASMKQSRQCSYDRYQQRPNERNELTDTRNQSEDKWTGKPQQREANCANHADEKAGGELCANVSGEGAIDVLKKFVTAPAPASARQHL